MANLGIEVSNLRIESGQLGNCSGQLENWSVQLENWEWPTWELKCPTGELRVAKHAVQYTHCTHCTKTNMYFRIKAEPVMAGVEAMVLYVYVLLLFTYCTLYLIWKPDINLCICSNRDQLGYFLCGEWELFWDRGEKYTKKIASWHIESEQRHASIFYIRLPHDLRDL